MKGKGEGIDLSEKEGGGESFARSGKKRSSARTGQRRSPPLLGGRRKGGTGEEFFASR